MNPQWQGFADLVSGNGIPPVWRPFVAKGIGHSLIDRFMSIPPSLIAHCIPLGFLGILVYTGEGVL